MKTGFLCIMGALQRVDVAPPPVDVVPPTTYLGLGLGALAALCCLVVVVAVVAFFVIRAIKKNRTAKEVPPAQNTPTNPNP
jgi:hypothetical protein